MKTETLLADPYSLHAALDSVQTNIFLADRDFKLVYMNPKAEKALSIIDSEIFRVFGIRVDNFIGESIHKFHRDPVRVTGILGNPSALPHEAFFDFSEVHLKTCINGIPGPEGEVISYIVNWKDVSEQVRLNEEKIKRVIELDNVDRESL